METKYRASFNKAVKDIREQKMSHAEPSSYVSGIRGVRETAQSRLYN